MDIAHGEPRVAQSLDDLLSLFDVEEIDRDLYRGLNPEPGGRQVLFGGHVAAQALRAAHRTVPDGFMPHSLHGYFLRPGQVDRPTILHVHRDRDGRSFSARRVEAIQDGQVILSLAVSHQRPEPGVEYRTAPLDAAPGPEDFFPANPLGVLGEWLQAFEFRVPALERPPAKPGYWDSPTTMWCRTTGPVGADPILHACLLTYVSDLSTGFGDADLPIFPSSGGPSLDHAMWLHRPLDVEQWFLIDLQPVIACGGRGLYVGGIYDHQRRRCASISQELLTRSPPPTQAARP